MSVALVLRAVPVVALLLSENLLEGNARYSSPQRLPFLLWTLAQAAMCAIFSLLCSRLICPAYSVIRHQRCKALLQLVMLDKYSVPCKVSPETCLLRDVPSLASEWNAPPAVAM